MIETCPRYGHKFNNKTCKRCPQCYPMKTPRNTPEDPDNDVTSFMRHEISQKKRVVNSYRQATMAKWEREHDKPAV